MHAWMHSYLRNIKQSDRIPIVVVYLLNFTYVLYVGKLLHTYVINSPGLAVSTQFNFRKLVYYS